MNYAEAIIEKLGGPDAVSERDHLPLSTVKSWIIRGNIPRRHWARLLKFAKRERLPLSAKDFVADIEAEASQSAA